MCAGQGAEGRDRPAAGDAVCARVLAARSALALAAGGMHLERERHGFSPDCEAREGRRDDLWLCVRLLASQ